MSDPDTNKPPRRTTLVWVAVLLAVTAAAWWGASLAGTTEPAMPGSATNASDMTALLRPFAALALAAIPAVIAITGLARQLVGAIIAIAAGIMLWRAVTTADAVMPGGLAILGAVTAWAAAGLLIFYSKAMPGLGRRYSTRPATRDTDRDAWRDLEKGIDPTTKDFSTDS